MPQPGGVMIDNERKKSLIMEKKLRACSANVIQRDRGYFTGEDAPPPVTKRPTTPSPSPAAVERARNPVALRYWNQCLDQSTTMNNNENIIDFKNNYNLEENSKQVDRILSTAGTGIKRENEVKEALGNINRFIMIDKVKKDDAARVSRSRTRPQKIEVEIGEAKCKPYNLIKEEQIKLSQERTNFQSKSTNRIPNSPKPFRRGLSETRIVSKDNVCSCNHKKEDPSTNQLINEIIPKMNDNQKTEFGVALLDQLPSNIIQAIIVEQLSKMSENNLISTMKSLPIETASMAVPVLFPRTKDDVKLSLILDSVPKLTKQLRK